MQFIGSPPWWNCSSVTTGRHRGRPDNSVASRAARAKSPAWRPVCHISPARKRPRPAAGAAVREVAPGPSLTFYEANILDRAALETIFTMHAVDVIIHFAGFKAVGESVAKPLEYYWNNIAGTLVLCEVAREHGCKNIVFSSSATVYGEPEFVPITESCPKHDATNPYGWTKSMLEQILSDLYT
ncbi:MAG: NAD-dependent epimerase/dehydratase family protein, partial [Adlercreutzia equolifaciens]